MKKIIVLFLILTLFTGWNVPANAAAKQGEAAGIKKEGSQVQKAGLKESKTESVRFVSKVLGKEMRMKVYLPKGYSESKKLPVLYLMHGMRDDESTIFMFADAADRLIESGKIQPLVIVAPYIENSFGSNTGEKLSFYNVPEMGVSLNVGMYEDYIYKEVIDYVKKHYNVIPSKEGQYIGGISMGGYAALHIAFKYPDSFSKVGGHSPALWFEGGPRGWLYANEDIMKKNDPIYLAENCDLKGIQIYLDCGDQDSYGFQNSSKSFYELLIKHNLRAEFHHSDGCHDMSYWGSQVDNYLLFYSPAAK